MAEVVLFHHAQGLTPGVVAFAGELRRAGHTVHTPDLFDGRTFGSIEDGMGYAQELGFPGEVLGRGARAVEGLPVELVFEPLPGRIGRLNHPPFARQRRPAKTREARHAPGDGARIGGRLRQREGLHPRRRAIWPSRDAAS